MLHLSYIFVILSALAQVSKLNAEQDTCLDDAFQICENASGVDAIGLIDKQVNEQKLPNEDFLNKYCETAKGLVECMLTASRKCKEKEAEFDFTFANELLYKLCDKNSAERKIYVENFECVNQNIPKMDKCMIEADKFIGNKFPDMDSLSEEDLRKVYCLQSHIQATVCIQGIITGKCGTAAGAFEEDIASYVLADNYETCSNYLNELLETYGDSIKNRKWGTD